MRDVGYHLTNLWFAGQKGNWPLAGFYLAETRSHLKWAVFTRPVRKTQAGDVDLDGIREAFDGSPLTGVLQAIEPLAKLAVAPERVEVDVEVVQFVGGSAEKREGTPRCEVSERPRGTPAAWR